MSRSLRSRSARVHFPRLVRRIPPTVESLVGLLGILKSTVDAKGDLLAGTAADTIARLAPGAAGTYLRRNDTPATGLEWTTALQGAVADTGGQVFNVQAAPFNVQPGIEGGAGIDAAIAAAAAVRGTVLFPPSPTSYLAANGISLSKRHGITIVGYGATLEATNTDRPALETLGVATADHFYLDAAITWYDIDPATSYLRGERVITLDTAADAANFTAGDYVWIVCRELVLASGTTPQAEINVVESVNVGAGTVTFRYPFAKNYTDDPSFRYAIGLANQLCTDIAIHGLTLTGVGRRPLGLYQVFGATLRDVTLRGNGGIDFRGRFLRGSNVRIEVTPDWASTFNPFWLALDTGTSDVEIDNLQVSSSGGSVLHLLEGIANVRLKGRVRNAPTDPAGDAWAALRVGAITWDIDLDLDVTNSPLASALLSSNSSVYTTEGNENLRWRGTFAGAVASGKHVVEATGIPPDVSGLQIDGAVTASHSNAATTVPLSRTELAIRRADTPATDPTDLSDSVIGWACPDAALTPFAGQVTVPDGASWAVVQIAWYNPDATSGNVTWRRTARAIDEGVTVLVAGTTNSVVDAAGGQNELVLTVFPAFAVTPGQRLNVVVDRNGAGGADTLTNDAVLVGAEVVWYR